jgi:hypothetical protein
VQQWPHDHDHDEHEQRALERDAHVIPRAARSERGERHRQHRPADHVVGSRGGERERAERRRREPGLAEDAGEDREGGERQRRAHEQGERPERDWLAGDHVVVRMQVHREHEPEGERQQRRPD